MKHVFKVTKCEVQKCFEFSEELYSKKAASLKQFGRPDILGRKMIIFLIHMIGKVVEFGFKRFLEHNFNMSFIVDFEGLG